MKTLILYNTRNGASEKYAKWLAEELKIPAKRFEDIPQTGLEAAEKIYVLSGTYGGQMPLVQFLKNNWDGLRNKKIIAIAVGMVPAGNWWSKISYWLIPKYVRNNIEFHKLPGWMPEKPETLKGVKKENLQQIK